MSDFWKTVKNNIEKGAETVKEGAETFSHNVSKKAPGVWADISGKTKELASTIAEKTEEAFNLSKLQIKHYKLNKQAEKVFAEIGGHVYTLSHNKTKKNVYEDHKIKKLFGDIRYIERNISIVDKNIAKLKTQLKKGRASKPKQSTGTKTRKSTTQRKTPKK